MSHNMAEDNRPSPMKTIGCQDLLGMNPAFNGWLSYGVNLVSQETMKKNPSFKGLLAKIMNKVKTPWLLKYVILHKGCIYIYNKDNSVKPRSAFSLYKYNRVVRATEENMWAFKLVHCNDNATYFSASSNRELKTWMKHINIMMRAANGKPELRISSLSQGSDSSDYSDVEAAIYEPRERLALKEDSEIGYTDDDEAEEDYIAVSSYGDASMDEDEPTYEDNTCNPEPPEIPAPSRKLPDVPKRDPPPLPDIFQREPSPVPPRHPKTPTLPSPTPILLQHKRPMAPRNNKKNIPDISIRPQPSLPDDLPQEDAPIPPFSAPPFGTRIQRKNSAVHMPLPPAPNPFLPLPTTPEQPEPPSELPTMQISRKPLGGVQVILPQLNGHHEILRKPPPPPKPGIKAPTAAKNEQTNGFRTEPTPDQSDVLAMAFWSGDTDLSKRKLEDIDVPGTFLIRESRKDDGLKVLVVYLDNGPTQFKIHNNNPRHYCIIKECSFPSLKDLVDYYQQNCLPGRNLKLGKPYKYYEN